MGIWTPGLVRHFGWRMLLAVLLLGGLAWRTGYASSPTTHCVPPAGHAPRPPSGSGAGAAGQRAEALRMITLERLSADELASPAVSGSVAEQELALLNQDRAQAGLPPLTDSVVLDGIAVHRAQQMAVSGLSHYLPGDPTPAAVELLRAAGVRYIWHGENIAWEQGTPASGIASFFNDWWMGSPEHKENLLNTHYRQVGIGAVMLDDGRVFIAEDFTD